MPMELRTGKIFAFQGHHVCITAELLQAFPPSWWLWLLAAVAGEGWGPDWCRSGSGTSIGVAVVVAVGYERRRFPRIVACGLSSFGLYSDSSGLEDDGAAIGAKGKGGMAPGEHAGDPVQTSRASGE